MDIGSMLIEMPNPTLTYYELGLVTAENKIQKDKLMVIEGAYNSLNTADSIYSGLLAVESILEKSVSEGKPLHPHTHRLLELTTKPAYGLLGMKKPKHFPGMETVTNKETEHVAVQICLEEVQDTVRRVAEKLAKLMDFIWEKIKEFFQYIVARLNNLAGNMRDLMQRVEELKNSDHPFEDFITALKPGNESVDKPAFLNRHILFSINGKCDGNTADQIITNTVTLLQANRLIIVRMMHSLELLALRNPTRSQVEEEAERLVKEIKEKMNQFTQTDRKNEGHQMVWSYGYFHDSYRFKLMEDIGKAHQDDEVRLFNIDLEMVRDKNGDEDYQVRVLSKQEMLKIGQDTVDLINKTREFEKVVPIVEKTLKSTAEKLHNNFVGTDDKEKRQDIMLSLELIKDIFQYVKKYLPKISHTAIEVAADATIYVRSSVARYELNK